jgi:hypothetical protein
MALVVVETKIQKYSVSFPATIMSATKNLSTNSKSSRKETQIKPKGSKESKESKVPKESKTKELVDVKETSSRFSAVGAPSQRSQPSRKGKKSWRKNVDLAEVEAGLEELREEERVIGSVHSPLCLFHQIYIIGINSCLRCCFSGPVHKKADEELFTIDLIGDAQSKLDFTCNITFISSLTTIFLN